MKKSMLFALSALILHACGSDDSTDVSNKPSGDEVVEKAPELEEEKETVNYALEEYEVVNYYSGDNIGIGYATPDEEPLFGTKRFDAAKPFYNGRAQVGKKVGDEMFYTFIDENGEEISGYDYAETGDFSDGMAWVKKVEDGKVGYINKSGELVLPMAYENEFDYVNGLALISNVKYNQFRPVGPEIQYGYIDIDGDTVIAMDKQWAGPFSDGFGPVITEAGKALFVDTIGTVAIDNDFSMVAQFANGIAPAAKNDKWGFINTAGEFIVEPSFENYKYVYSYNGISEMFAEKRRRYKTEEGYFIVSKKELWGIIDQESNEVLPIKYTDVGVPNEGLVEVKMLKEKIDYRTYFYVGLYNLKTQKMVIEPKYDEVREMLSVGDIDKGQWYKIGLDTDYDIYGPEVCGVVNIETGVMIDPQFDDAEVPSEGLMAVKKDGLWGYVDYEGEIVIDYKFESGDNFEDGKIFANTPGGEYNYFDKTGAVLKED